MYIHKPIGSRIDSCELPGGSTVNITVVEASDGLPSLRITAKYSWQVTRGVDLTIADLLFIADWAQKQ